MAMRFIVIALVVIVLVSIIWGSAIIRHGFSARETPSAVEAYVARATRKIATPKSARDAKNPFVATPELLAEARAHFADHCASCHANDGSGDTEMGRNLYPKAPDMRLPQTQNLSDGEIYYIIHNGVALTGMPAWGPADKVNNDEDSWKLVLLIRHLPQLTAQEVTEMQKLNPKSPAELQEEEQEENFLNQGTTP
jgi:mono/diheme cytochrome c family protein